MVTPGVTGVVEVGVGVTVMVECGVNVAVRGGRTRAGMRSGGPVVDSANRTP